MAALPNVFSARGWQADLKFKLAARGDKTVIGDLHHRGPLTVQRPFYPGDGACHVYLLHPPGGIVEGDRLTIEAHALAGAHGLLTSPAATKFYRCTSGLESVQRLVIVVHPSARLEWLPQESIIFTGAAARMESEVHLSDGAKFLGWDLVCLGNPAVGLGLGAGCCATRWAVFLEQSPILIERQRIDAEAVGASWGLRGAAAQFTLFGFPAGERELAVVRELCLGRDTVAVTLIGNLLVCRGLGRYARELSAVARDVWSALRPLIMGVGAQSPRIWST